jgi:hypothetical protein
MRLTNKANRRDEGRAAGSARGASVLSERLGSDTSALRPAILRFLGRFPILIDAQLGPRVVAQILSGKPD